MKKMKELFSSILCFTIISVLIFEGKPATNCRHYTTLTIFVDLDRFHERYFEDPLGKDTGLRHLITVIQNILRDPCFEGRLYNQLERRFIELDNDESMLNAHFELVFLKSNFIEKTEVLKWNENLNTYGTRRDIIFYLTENPGWSSKNNMELKNISMNSQNAFVIIGHWMIKRFTEYRYPYEFPELAWLPVHRLVVISNNFSGNKGLPICFQSLLDVIKNPNFNRFQYNRLLFDDILMSRFQDFKANSDVYFTSPIESLDLKEVPHEFIFIDIDATFQLMLILRDFFQQKGKQFHVVMGRNYYGNRWSDREPRFFSGMMSEAFLYEKLDLSKIRRDAIGWYHRAVMVSTYDSDHHYNIKQSVIRIVVPQYPQPSFGPHEKIFEIVDEQDMLTMQFLEKLIRQILSS